MQNNICVSKIRCKNPNQKKTHMSNMMHLKYIASRPGVDLTPFSTDDSEDTTYLRYIHERPRSHGLFGNLPDEEIDDLDSLSKKMYHLSTPIYRGIVSLSAEDAVELGYDNKTKWACMLHATMPDIANEFGIPASKLAWVAAFHQEEGHPHVHYMMWRTDDNIQSPYIHTSTQNRCREIFSSEIFQEEREQHVTEKTFMRDKLIKLSSDVMENRFVDRIDPEKLDSISNQFVDFIRNLPESGRLAYKFLPPADKERMQSLIDNILSIPQLSNMYHSYLESVDNISLSYSVVGDKKVRNLNRAEANLRSRIANAILHTAKKAIKNHYIDTPPDNIFPSDNTSQTGANAQYNDNESASTDSPINIQTYDEPPEEFSVSSSHSSRVSRAGKRRQFGNARGGGSSALFTLFTKEFKEARKLINTPASDNAEENKQRVNKIINLLKKEVRNNNPLAMMELGNIYNKGTLLKRDTTLAKEYYTSGFKQMINMYNSANETDDILRSYLSYRIGKCYSSGIGIEQDIEKAKAYFRISIETGDNKGYAKYALAKIYLSEFKAIKESVEKSDNSPDDVNIFDQLDFTTEELVSLLSKAAEEGESPFAHYALADLYADGEPLLGIDKSTDKAYTHYSKALSGFLSIAKTNTNDYIYYNIGRMYLKGLGTEVNVKEAIPYLSLAAEQKNEYALFDLAKLYLNSKADEPGKTNIDIKNLIFSLKDFTNLSVLNKTSDDLKRNTYVSKQARYYLGRLYLQPDTPTYNPDVGIKCLTKLSKESSPDVSLGGATEQALFELAKIYLRPTKGTEQQIKLYTNTHNKIDTQNLISSLKKIADIDNDTFKGLPGSTEWNQSVISRAQYYLGRIYLENSSPYYNLDLGIKYLFTAATTNTFAAFELARLYLYRDNGSIDPDNLYKTQVSQKINAEKLILILENTSQQPVDESNKDTIAQAQYYLGRIYLDRLSPYNNLDLAIKYLFMAASNNPFAAFRLAGLYLYQDKGTKDSDNIYRKQASEKVNISEVFRILKELSDDPEHKKDAEITSQAQYYLGRIHLKEGTPYYDLDLALKYLNMAAENNVSALTTLGGIYLWGKHGIKDKKKGLELLNRAIERGDQFAQEQIDIYNKVQQSNYIYLGYSLVNLIFFSLSSPPHESDKNTAEKSKKARRELYRKNLIRDSFLD